MGGAAGAQAGVAGMGAILGGIGDIIQAQNYHRPRLPPAVGYEQRLRQLAQSQLLGGGQQLLGATALYNQMAPVLMSQLPGMSYHPGSAAGAVGDTIMSGGGAGGSPMASYQQSLQNRSQQQALQQHLTALNAQMKGLKPGASPQRKSLRQERKSVKQELKGLPTAAQLERQSFMTGTQPNPELYDIRMGGGGMQGTSSAGMGDQGFNLGGGGGGGGDSGSLASVRGLMDALGGGQPHPDFLSSYYGAGGSQF